MKKSIIYSSLCDRKGEAFGRNFSSMSTKTKRKYVSIMLFSLTSKIIKGKLGFNRKTADANFGVLARAIFNALTLDVQHFFTVPFTQLALLGTQCTEFDTAVGKVKTHALGAEGIKNTAKKSLMKTLLAALDYVNELARQNEKDAVAIITSAKMVVINNGSKNKDDFAVKQGNSASEIILISKAVKDDNGKYLKATYEWQVSIDKGVTWENLPTTTNSKTTAINMLPGIATEFRKRTFTNQTGFTNWCPSIEIIPQ